MDIAIALRLSVLCAVLLLALEFSPMSAAQAIQVSSHHALVNFTSLASTVGPASTAANVVLCAPIHLAFRRSTVLTTHAFELCIFSTACKRTRLLAASAVPFAEASALVSLLTPFKLAAWTTAMLET